MRTDLVIAMLAAIFAGSAARAQNGVTPPSSDDYLKIIQWQNEQIANLNDRVTALENKEPAAAPAVTGGWPAWVDTVKISGDLRYRHELIDSDGSEHRNRHRIRARVGIKAKLTDEIDLGFQLASGSDDPVSTNATLDGGFSSKSVWIDKAYFDYHPEAVEGLSILGGKFSNPFDTHQGSPLVWDGDLRVEGIAATYEPDCETLDVYVAAGGFWIEERSSSPDSSLWAVQGSVAGDIADGARGMIGASYYAAGNAEGYAPFYDSTDSFGNTLDTMGNYMYGFSIGEFFAELSGEIADGVKASVFGSYVQNFDADDCDTGWIAGFSLARGPVKFKYNYRVLESNTVIGAFTDSDFGGGGTDAQGHQVGVSYAINKKVSCGVTAFFNEQGLNFGDPDCPSAQDKNEYNRFQFDVQFKF